MKSKKEKYAEAIYDFFCEVSCLGGFMSSDDFDWIAGKVFCERIEAAVKAEREACALMADNIEPAIAAAIRDRQ